MSIGSAPAVLAPLEETRFGVRTARTAGFVTAQSLPDVLEFCAANEVKFLIARSRAEEIGVAQDMEQRGFLITETTLFLVRDLTNTPVPPHEGTLTIRSLAPGEEPTVRAIAAQSFQGYFGHYHADARLDRAKCDEAYIDWAGRSCVSPELADAVLVAEAAGVVIGFLTLKRNSVDESQPMLSGVNPEGRRQGAYRMLIRQGLEWAQRSGAVRSVAAVHVANAGVLRALGKLGYEPTYAFYTFHKWFD
jgi:GNAT superfamily N-acetyltransferase